MQSESYFWIAIVLLALLLLVNSLQLYLKMKRAQRMEPYSVSGSSHVGAAAPTLRPVTIAPGIKGRLSGNT